MNSESRKIKYQNKRYTYSQLLLLARTKFNNDISLSTLKQRIYHGWSIDDALSIKKGKSRPKKLKIITYKNSKYTYNQLLQLAEIKFNNPLTLNLLMMRMAEGWSIDDILSIPKKDRTKSVFTYNGEKYTLEQLRNLAKSQYNMDLNTTTLRSRLNYGWSVKEAISTPTGQRRNISRVTVKSVDTNNFKKLKKDRFNAFNTFVERLATKEDLIGLQTIISERRHELLGGR